MSAESVEHVLLDCFLYNTERQVLFDYIRDTRNILCASLESYNRKSLISVLLFGEHPFDYDRYPYNKLLFRAVQSFLVKIGRLKYKSVLQLT